MADKTIHEIKDAFGANQAGIANRYRDTLDDIARTHRVEEVGAFGTASPPKNGPDSSSSIRQRAGEIRAEALTGYSDALRSYRAELEGRVRYLRPRLFGVEDAGILSCVALASDEQLRTLMDRAALADNRQLAKAVFFEATQRGAGDLMARYFDEVDPEARDLYAEWGEIPTAEAIERQAENVETIIPTPNPANLTPPARVAS